MKYLPIFTFFVATNYWLWADSSPFFMCPVLETGMKITWCHKERLSPLPACHSVGCYPSLREIYFSQQSILGHLSVYWGKISLCFFWITWIRLPNTIVSEGQMGLHHASGTASSNFSGWKYPSFLAAMIRNINMGCCLSPVLAVLLRHCCSLSCSQGWETLDIVLYLQFLSLFQMLDLRSLTVTMPQ